MFPIGEVTSVPPLRWGPIHEGHGIEHVDGPGGAPADWSLMIFGLTENEFSRLTDRLADSFQAAD